MCARARLPMIVLGCVLASLIACKRDRSDAAVKADEAILSNDLRKAVCNTEPCGGDQPVIEVYRDASGKVRKLYRLYGACSHSPGIYFEPDGTKSEIIPEKPVIPGSPEANEFQARHQKHVRGLNKTDWIRCSDGLRLPPPTPP